MDIAAIKTLHLRNALILIANKKENLPEKNQVKLKCCLKCLSVLILLSQPYSVVLSVILVTLDT